MLRASDAAAMVQAYHSARDKSTRHAAPCEGTFVVAEVEMEGRGNASGAPLRQPQGGASLGTTRGGHLWCAFVTSRRVHPHHGGAGRPL